MDSLIPASLIRLQHGEDDLHVVVFRRLEVHQIRVVGPHVGLPADPLIELLVAQLAAEPLLLAVYPHVLRQVLLPREGFRTDVAREEFLFGVHDTMLLEVALRVELHAATRADVVVVRMGDFKVHPVLLPVLEHFAALGTDVGALRGAVDLGEVRLLQRPGHETLAAYVAQVRPALPRFGQMLTLRL